jgi:hypothetical protein
MCGDGENRTHAVQVKELDPAFALTTWLSLEGGGPCLFKVHSKSGKLASLNHSWKSKEATQRALGMTGIEPRHPSQIVSVPSFSLSQLR